VHFSLLLDVEHFVQPGQYKQVFAYAVQPFDAYATALVPRLFEDGD
jgi:hypothetical protein